MSVRVGQWLFVCLLVGAVGCTKRITDFTLISTKNTLLVAKAERLERRISGEDCVFTLVGLPNMKSAIDDALQSAGSGYDALIDGVVWYEDRFIYVCYRVEGTPVRMNPEEARRAVDERQNGGSSPAGGSGPATSPVVTDTGRAMFLAPASP